MSRLSTFLRRVLTIQYNAGTHYLPDYAWFRWTCILFGAFLVFWLFPKIF